LKTALPCRNRILLLLFILISLINCTIAQNKVKGISGVYRLINEVRDGFEICIVDGPIVRQKIYPEFLYGGNEQRYLFNPKGEIWIDNSISVEEYKYTVAHELNERHLMAEFGYTYSDAHDSSLRIERMMRLSDLALSKKHEIDLPKVSPYDCDGIKEIPGLTDSIKLNNVYLQLYAVKDGIYIWVVNGAIIRRDIYPDFGLSGNDFSYHFIPKNEIWIDAQISCEETEFSIICELTERKYMSEGKGYDFAYEKALEKEIKFRESKFREAGKKHPVIIPKVLERDKGTGRGNN
jgi:hypothetical protein